MMNPGRGIADVARNEAKPSQTHCFSRDGFGFPADWIIRRDRIVHVMTFSFFTIKNCYMVLNDVSILTKKILVGFFIYMVPLAIIGGGLWLIKFLFTK
jgi:hypothetical protein